MEASDTQLSEGRPTAAYELPARPRPATGSRPQAPRCGTPPRQPAPPEHAARPARPHHLAPSSAQPRKTPAPFRRRKLKLRAQVNVMWSWRPSPHHSREKKAPSLRHVEGPGPAVGRSAGPRGVRPAVRRHRQKAQEDPVSSRWSIRLGFSRNEGSTAVAQGTQIPFPAPDWGWLGAGSWPYCPPAKREMAFLLSFHTWQDWGSPSPWLTRRLNWSLPKQLSPVQDWAEKYPVSPGRHGNHCAERRTRSLARVAARGCSARGRCKRWGKLQRVRAQRRPHGACSSSVGGAREHPRALPLPTWALRNPRLHLLVKLLLPTTPQVLLGCLERRAKMKPAVPTPHSPGPAHKGHGHQPCRAAACHKSSCPVPTSVSDTAHTALRASGHRTPAPATSTQNLPASLS